jgi:hypothetical protein
LIETSPPGRAAAGVTLSIRGVPFDFNLIGPVDATLRLNPKIWRPALRMARVKRPPLQIQRKPAGLKTGATEPRGHRYKIYRPAARASHKPIAA